MPQLTISSLSPFRAHSIGEKCPTLQPSSQATYGKGMQPGRAWPAAKTRSQARDRELPGIRVCGMERIDRLLDESLSDKPTPPAIYVRVRGLPGSTVYG